MVDTVNYMQKLTTAVIAYSILLIFAIPAFAIDATSSTTRKATTKDRIETKRELVKSNIDTQREKISSRAATLRERLLKFKDQKKATRVENVNQNLTTINQNRTDQMLKFLNTTTSILNKLQTRVTQANSKGKDVTEVNAAITTAKASIASASAAVTTQSQKDYTITVTLESKVKTDAKITRDNLHTDLMSVWEQVIAAKKSVAMAIEIAATTLGEDNGK